MAGVGVAARDLGRAAVVERDREAIVAQRGDPAGFAVDDADPAVVAAGDDAVADGEGPIAVLDLFRAEDAGLAQPLASAR